jgi:hypothetical protein
MSQNSLLRLFDYGCFYLADSSDFFAVPDPLDVLPGTAKKKPSGSRKKKTKKSAGPILPWLAEKDLPLPTFPGRPDGGNVSKGKKPSDRLAEPVEDICHEPDCYIEESFEGVCSLNLSVLVRIFFFSQT